MRNESLSVNRESSKTELDEEDLKFLREIISKYDLRESNSKALGIHNYEQIVRGLENCYFVECKKPESFSQKIRKSFSTFTVLPGTTVDDYLSNTTLNISANQSIAGDWKKVGNQLWLSYFKQLEAKR